VKTASSLCSFVWTLSVCDGRTDGQNCRS